MKDRKEKEINKMFEQVCLESGVVEKALKPAIKITGGLFPVPLSEILGMESFEFKISESDYEADVKLKDIIKDNMVKMVLTGGDFLPYNICIQPDTMIEMGDPNSEETDELGFFTHTLSTNMNVVIRGCKLAKGWRVDNTEDDYTMLLVNTGEKRSVENYYNEYNCQKKNHIESIENVRFLGKVKNWFVKTFRKNVWTKKLHFPKPYTPHMVILDSIKMDIHEVEATLGTLVLRKNTNENSVHINMIMNNPEKNKAIETDVLDGVFNEVNKETDRRIADATQLIVNARKRRNIIHNSSEHLYQNLVVS